MASCRKWLSTFCTVVVNSFFVCMFLAMLQWQMPLYLRQIVYGCFLLGLAPFLCCFVSLATKRKSGWGICGSSCFVVVLCVACDRFASSTSQLGYVLCFHFTYFSFRTVPQSIYGQTRGKKNSEFLEVKTCLVDKVPAVDHKKNLIHTHVPIPAGSRLLRTEANKGNPVKILCVFGIYRSMSQFVDGARVLWHPFDELRNLPDRMIRILFTNLTESPHQLTKLRCQFLQKRSKRAAALHAAERE